MEDDTGGDGKLSGEEEFQKMLDSAEITEILDDDEVEAHRERLTRILLSKGVVLDGEDMDTLLTLKLFMQSAFIRRLRVRGSARAQKEEFTKAMDSFTDIPDIELQCEGLWRLSGYRKGTSN